jgi:hypothetical protein
VCECYVCGHSYRYRSTLRVLYLLDVMYVCRWFRSGGCGVAFHVRSSEGGNLSSPLLLARTIRYRSLNYSTVSKASSWNDPLKSVLHSIILYRGGLAYHMSFSTSTDVRRISFLLRDPTIQCLSQEKRKHQGTGFQKKFYHIFQSSLNRSCQPQQFIIDLPQLWRSPLSTIKLSSIQPLFCASFATPLQSTSSTYHSRI